MKEYFFMTTTVGELTDKLSKYNRSRKVILDANTGLFGVSARLMVEDDLFDEPDEDYFETIMIYNSIFDEE